MALDPVEVARLLEAARQAQWAIRQGAPDEYVTGIIATSSTDAEAVLSAFDLVPELAADWLRLRTELDETRRRLTFDQRCRTVLYRDGGRVGCVRREGHSGVCEFPARSLASGVSEGNPE